MASFRKDPLYHRWRSALCRYYYPESAVSLNRHPGDALTMASEWQPPDAQGFVAFRTWVAAELLKHNVGSRKYKIERRDPTKGFGPDNCYIAVVAKEKPTPEADLLSEKNVPFAQELSRLEVLYGLRAA